MHDVYLFEDFSALKFDKDSVKLGITNILFALVPSVPASNNGFLNKIA